ncbi:hypothetical protein CYMTET_27888 [Cymbomonas tetramitiformis]|uniref:EamA domain-containing protein n=1 Tax=Cymbomonas tetramitiformis TaxID=36881 RepID=A0AAE0KWF8_9CHLO|nr:hypothetical protein CYMTET_27888 [Cymbomonas tetramitiformis]
MPCQLRCLPGCQARLSSKRPVERRRSTNLGKKQRQKQNRIIVSALDHGFDKNLGLDINPRWEGLREISPRFRGLLLLNCLTVLFGSNMTVLKDVEEALSATDLAAVRFTLAAFALLPLLPRALEDRGLRRAGGELGVWLGTAYLTQAVGLASTGASRAAFISSFMVIVVPMLAGLYGAKIKKSTWVAALLALLGVGLLETGGEPPAVGDLWMLLSAVLFGVHIFRSEAYAHLVEEDTTLNLIALQVSVIAAISTAAAVVSHGTNSADIDLSFHGVADVWRMVQGLPWPQLLYTGLFTSAGCLWLEVKALRDVSAADAAMVYSMEPLWGAFFAWLLLGEHLTVQGWVGAMFIMSGSLVSQLGGEKKAEPMATVAEHVEPTTMDTSPATCSMASDFEDERQRRALMRQYGGPRSSAARGQ